VIDYVVSRYGEFVLLKPRFSLRNALLWGTPVVLLLFGGAVLFVSQRRRRTGNPALSAEKAAELDRIVRPDAFLTAAASPNARARLPKFHPAERCRNVVQFLSVFQDAAVAQPMKRIRCKDDQLPQQHSSRPRPARCSASIASPAPRP
jgi:hypothetical protein